MKKKHVPILDMSRTVGTSVVSESIKIFLLITVLSTAQRPFAHPIHMSHTSRINYAVRSADGRMLSNILSPPALTFLGKSGLIITSVNMCDIMLAFLAICTYVRCR